MLLTHNLIEGLFILEGDKPVAFGVDLTFSAGQFDLGNLSELAEVLLKFVYFAFVRVKLELMGVKS